MEDQKEQKEHKKSKKEQAPAQKQEMSLAEAKAYRASLNKPKAAELTEKQVREQFRIFWAQEKAKYGKAKDLEEIVWLHLKASKLDAPEKFEAGLAHFGLKKIR